MVGDAVGALLGIALGFSLIDGEDEGIIGNVGLEDVGVAVVGAAVGNDVGA